MLISARASAHACAPNGCGVAAMFRYFPTNYVWNLSVDLAIEMGARIGEIEEMCAPLQEAAKQPDAAGTAGVSRDLVENGATSSARSPKRTRRAAG